MPTSAMRFNGRLGFIVMWPLKKSKQYKSVIQPLRKCFCGEMSYGPLRTDDAVHCNHCGATFLIQFVTDPVAKKKWVEIDA